MSRQLRAAIKPTVRAVGEQMTRRTLTSMNPRAQIGLGVCGFASTASLANLNMPSNAEGCSKTGASLPFDPHFPAQKSRTVAMSSRLLNWER